MTASNFQSVRREYGQATLEDTWLTTDPMQLCQAWLAEALASEQTDATAMVLSTVDAQGMPDARVVLLKEIHAEGFVFYSHYDSAKGEQLAAHPPCALTFYWPLLARQLRIRGVAKRLPVSDSDAYFAARPYESQLSASISPQSQVILNRQVLEQAMAQLQKNTPPGAVTRPEQWGGYVVVPRLIECWQGRNNRLHDRFALYPPSTRLAASV